MRITKAKIALCAPFLLFFCTFWGAGAVVAQDFIAGTVLAVDFDRMEIDLLPVPADSSEIDHQKTKSIKARLSSENQVVNGMGRRVFPGCVFPGGMIRMWGHMDDGIFMISDIRGPGRGGGRGDPTGVRRRLQKMGPGYCPGSRGGVQ